MRNEEVNTTESNTAERSRPKVNTGNSYKLQAVSYKQIQNTASRQLETRDLQPELQTANREPRIKELRT